jgi:hypothetical protein
VSAAPAHTPIVGDGLWHDNTPTSWFRRGDRGYAIVTAEGHWVVLEEYLVHHVPRRRKVADGHQPNVLAASIAADLALAELEDRR